MRLIAGLLLAGAALLKAVSLVSEPSTALAHPLGSFFLPIQIVLEFALGLLLLSGVYWRTLRWFTVLLFSAFASYSLYLVLTGAPACGCFGPLRIHPWWTFSLDLAVVLGLYISPLAGRPQGILPVEHRRTVIATMMAAAVLITGIVVVRYVNASIAVAQDTIKSSGLVVLEPEHWIGKPLPIADAIDRDLSSGEWLAVLHRHDCPVCQEMVPRYEQLASIGQRIALVEVPPYGYIPSLESACICCQLTDDREWFVETPIEIRLRDGIVTAVSRHDH